MTGSDFSLLWTCFWQTGLCLVVGGLAALACSRRPARAHGVLLLAVVAALLTPLLGLTVRQLDWGLLAPAPSAEAPRPALDHFPIEESEKEPLHADDGSLVAAADPSHPVLPSAGPSNRDAVPSAPAAAPATPQRAESPRLSWITWNALLLPAWAVASLLALARLAASLVLGLRVLRSGRPLENGRIARAIAAAAARLHLQTAPRSLVSTAVRCPMIWCWSRRPILVFPDALVRTPPSVDWESIACHELAHWKRRDHLAALLAELLVAAFPWQPAAWWARRQLARWSETACDDWVLATGHDGAAYAESLVRLIPQRRPALVLPAVSRGAGLAGRVRRILAGPPRLPQAGRRWTFAATLLTACMAVMLAAAQTRPSDPSEAVSESRSEQDTAQARSAERDEDPLPEGAVLRLGTTRLRHPNRVNCVVFSPDGKTVVSGSDWVIRFWDVATGRKVQELPAGAKSVAFSPDGKMLASGGRGAYAGPIRLWDIETGKELFSRDAHRPDGRNEGVVNAVAFSPDGLTFASAGQDRAVRLWNVATGEELLVLQTVAADTRPADVHGVAYSPDGTSLAAAYGPVIRVWDLEQGDEAFVIENAHQRQVSTLAFSPDGMTLLSGGHRFHLVHDEVRGPYADPYAQVRAWDAGSGEWMENLLEDEAQQFVRGMTFSADGKLVLALSHDLRVLEITDGKATLRASGDYQNLFGAIGAPEVAISPDGRTVAATGGHHAVGLWSAETGKRLQPTPESHEGRVWTVAASPDGTLVATGGSDGVVRVWEGADGRPRHGWSLKSGLVRSVAFSADGRLLAAGGDDPSASARLGRYGGVVELYDVETGNLTSPEIPFDDRVVAVAFSADGERLAVATGLGRRLGPGSVSAPDPAIHLVDASSGEILAQFRGQTSRILGLAILAEGNLFASLSEGGGIRLWDATNGTEDTVISQEARAAFRQAAFSPDGRFAVTWRVSDETPSLWDLHRREELGPVPVTERYGTVALSPEARLLATAANNNAIVRLWDARSGRELLSLESEMTEQQTLAFSPDGRRLITGRTDGSTLIWDVTPAYDKLEVGE